MTKQPSEADIVTYKRGFGPGDGESAIESIGGVRVDATPTAITRAKIDYRRWLEGLRMLDALMALPRHTLWAVGSMEEGPFARLILPQPDGGYSGGYVEAYGDTPAEAIRAALANAAPAQSKGDK